MLQRALILLLLVAAGPAAARELVIESFDVSVKVRTDGIIEVTEVLRPRFTGSWNGIYRTIPVEYRTPQGLNYTLLLDLDSVTDEGGAALRYESSRERHYRKIKIWVPGARDATRTVTLRYRVRNGLKFFEDHDELYWNVTGDEWEVPIESATARIVLPGGATGIRTLAFTGAYGSTEQDASVEVRAQEVFVRMRRSLSFREGLTAVVGWDRGLVRRPGALERVGLFLRSNWPLFFPIGVFVVMYQLWWATGRDPRKRPLSTQYGPPEGLTPAEAGTLLDNSADMRDLTATLVDLAVRGYLLIEEKKEEKLLGLWSEKEYVLHLQKKGKEGLKPHERELLDAIFSSRGDRVELSDLENSFYRNLPHIRDRIYDALLARRYYNSRPDHVKRTYLIAALVVGLLTVWGGGFLSAKVGMAFGTIVFGGLLSAAIIAGFAFVMPARTLDGTRALEHALGFEEFLGRVEADRMDRMIRSPEMFEKYLAFAMAFGVEKNWAKAFEGIYSQPPQWYRGADFTQFSPRSFTADLGRLSSRAGAMMVSAPRSSGGSGFGGGGFSGGGFGGGGGGGF